MENKKTSFKIEWLKKMLSVIRNTYTVEEISNEEIKDILLELYSKKENPIGRYYNNNTKSNKEMSLETFINYYLTNDFILTGYNVLVKNQEESQSIALQALDYILEQRSYNKKIMEASEKGSHDYVYYRVLQLTFKILANSYYGILSMASSSLYNPHIQNSITLTAQNLISSAIYLVEAFMYNNEDFNTANEIIDFCDNICYENYKITELLDNNITKDKLYDYLLSKCKTVLMDSEKYVIEKFIKKLNQDSVNRIYYKNNLFELLKNKYFSDKLIQLTNENKIDKEFETILVDIVCYNHIAWDKYNRISTQKRKGSIVTDTDSTFIYLGKLIRNFCDHFNFDCNKIHMSNVLISIITEALRRTFWEFTKNSNIPNKYRPIIQMKNEFLYSKVLTTKNKKNYAGWLISELGKEIPGDNPDKHLDIKGLAIRKTTVAKSLRNAFQDLLVKDILLPDKINLKRVYNDYMTISNYVTASIKSGSTEFLIPKTVDEFENYKNPESTETVKSTIIWNALEPNNAITPPDNVKLLKITAPTLDCANMLKLKEKYPDKYEILENVVFNPSSDGLDISKNGITAISIPLDLEKLPPYLELIVNYNTMIISNVKNANILLESLGILCINDTKDKTKMNYKTNIIEF